MLIIRTNLGAGSIGQWHFAKGILQGIVLTVHRKTLWATITVGENRYFLNVYLLELY
jgi:hypothetical protein